MPFNCPSPICLVLPPCPDLREMEELALLMKLLVFIWSSSLLTDAVCLKECQKKLRSLYQTKNRVKIVPWEQTSAVDINKIYADLSWVMDHRTPRGVTEEELNHYTEIFVRREPHPAPKRILVYGQPGKWGSKVS